MLRRNRSLLYNTVNLISLTKGESARVSTEDFEWLSAFKWCINGNGYAVRNGVRNGKRTMIQMHREIINAKEGEDVDHINKCKTDNRRENLRVCSRSQNLCNVGKTSKNKSGYKGVSYDVKNKKYAAHVCFRGKQKNLGRYATPEEAHREYIRASKTLHGDFHCPN